MTQETDRTEQQNDDEQFKNVRVDRFATISYTWKEDLEVNDYLSPYDAALLLWLYADRANELGFGILKTSKERLAYSWKVSEKEVQERLDGLQKCGHIYQDDYYIILMDWRRARRLPGDGIDNGRGKVVGKGVARMAIDKERRLTDAGKAKYLESCDLTSWSDLRVITDKPDNRGRPKKQKNTSGNTSGNSSEIPKEMKKKNKNRNKEMKRKRKTTAPSSSTAPPSGEEKITENEHELFLTICRVWGVAFSGDGPGWEPKPGRDSERVLTATRNVLRSGYGREDPSLGICVMMRLLRLHNKALVEDGKTPVGLGNLAGDWLFDNLQQVHNRKHEAWYEVVEGAERIGKEVKKAIRGD